MAYFYWLGRLSDIFVNFEPLDDEIEADLSYLESDTHKDNYRPEYYKSAGKVSFLMKLAAGVAKQYVEQNEKQQQIGIPSDLPV